EWKNCCKNSFAKQEKRPRLRTKSGPSFFCVIFVSHQGGVICIVNVPPVDWPLFWLITNIVFAFTGYSVKLNVLDGPPFVPAAVIFIVLRFPDAFVPSPLIVADPLNAESWNAPWLELSSEKSIAPVMVPDVANVTWPTKSSSALTLFVELVLTPDQLNP